MKPLVLICRHKIMRDYWQENLDERPTYEKCRNNFKGNGKSTPGGDKQMQM